MEAEFRITIELGPETGLRVRSQVMADKPVTIRRERIGLQIGRLVRCPSIAITISLGDRIHAAKGIPPP